MLANGHALGMQLICMHISDSQRLHFGALLVYMIVEPMSWHSTWLKKAIRELLASLQSVFVCVRGVVLVSVCGVYVPCVCFA